MEKIRINKFLADSGICSRRKADEHILAGDISINDVKATIGAVIDPEIAKVKFKGNLVEPHISEFEYWAVYKPKGYVSTTSDEQNRPCVTDLVKSKSRLYPIGRLDFASEGLIILTNDGDFTQKLSHPSFSHKKEYKVFARPFKEQSINEISRSLLRGMLIEGKRMKASKINSIEKLENGNMILINLELITGYNRQIRRMCDKIGLDVAKLIRTGIANLKLSDLNLKPGDSVKISKDNII